jgi:hypothetical protein
MSEAVKPSRTCFLDFPLGWHTLPYRWSADGDRSWEETTDNLYRNGGLAITSAHMAAHAAVGESLVGKERAFAMKCNC